MPRDWEENFQLRLKLCFCAVTVQSVQSFVKSEKSSVCKSLSLSASLVNHHYEHPACKH